MTDLQNSTDFSPAYDPFPDIDKRLKLDGPLFMSVCAECGARIYKQGVLAAGTIFSLLSTDCLCSAEDAMNRREQAIKDAAADARKAFYGTLKKHFKHDNMLFDAAYKHMDLADFKPAGSEQQIVYAKLKQFEPGSQSVYLYGPTGVGKTHLSIAICRDARRRGKSVLAVRSIDLLDKLRRAYNKSDDYQHELIDCLRQVDVLLIDDIGQEKPSDWVRDRLYNIIDYRYNRTTTIVTSNLSNSEIQERLGEGIASRLAGSALSLLVSGQDYRRLRA